jgi:hypothetical protein
MGSGLRGTGEKTYANIIAEMQNLEDINPSLHYSELREVQEDAIFIKLLYLSILLHYYNFYTQ